MLLHQNLEKCERCAINGIDSTLRSAELRVSAARNSRSRTKIYRKLHTLRIRSYDKSAPLSEPALNF